VAAAAGSTRSPLTLPSRPRGRCGIKNPIWVGRLASSRLASAPQSLPLRGAVQSPPASHRPGAPRPARLYRSSPFADPRSGAQREGSFVILRPCTGKPSPFAGPPCTGEGARSSRQPLALSPAAPEMVTDEPPGSGEGEEALPCSELVGGQAWLPLARFPAGSCFTDALGTRAVSGLAGEMEAGGAGPVCGVLRVAAPALPLPARPAARLRLRGERDQRRAGFGHRVKKHRPVPVWEEASVSADAKGDGGAN